MGDDDDCIEEEEPADRVVGSLVEAVQEHGGAVQEDKEIDMIQTTGDGKETDEEDRINADEEAAAMDDRHNADDDDDDEEEEANRFESGVQDEKNEVQICRNDEDKDGAGNEENDGNCIEEEEPADGEVGSLSEAVQEDIETDMNQTTEVGKETDKEDRYNVDEAAAMDDPHVLED